MKSQQYWKNVYADKSELEVSWYQDFPQQSLDYIKSAGLSHNAHLFDIGGGASTLIDALIEQGYQQLSVLDIAEQALKSSQNRLRHHSNKVNWYVTDILAHQFKPESVDLWHDRAVFHFLINDRDQDLYLAKLNNALKPGGFVVLSTFDIGGPLKCSGLSIKQYSWQSLSQKLGDDFKLINHCQHNHQTPFGTSQLFNYCIYRKVVNNL